MAVLSAVLARPWSQQRIGPLALDDAGHHRRLDRLHIGGVGQVRIGHDRRRIGIDEE